MASPWGSVDAEFDALGHGFTAFVTQEGPALYLDEGCTVPWSFEPVAMASVAYSEPFDLQLERPLKLEALHHTEPVDEAGAVDGGHCTTLAVVPAQPLAVVSTTAAAGIKTLTAFKRKSPSPAEAQVLSSSRLVKRRCRDKIDEHLQMLAESVPGCVERLSPKRPFRNQILEHALEYVGRLQSTISALHAQIQHVDACVDYALCQNRSVSVDAATLERIKAVLTRRGVSPEDMQQTQVILRIFGGAKAFLLNQFTGKLYFFRGASYTRFDIGRKEPDTGYPRTLGNWPGLFSKDIDAACHLPNEHACFFSGSQFVKYDICADHSLPGYPKAIDQASWPGLSFSSVDACLNWRNEKLYFFSGDMYAAFDLERNCQDPGYPRRIKDGWRLLGMLMPDGIDSAVAFDGKAYIIKGNLCVRYDMIGTQPDAPEMQSEYDGHLNPLVFNQ